MAVINNTALSVKYISKSFLMAGLIYFIGIIFGLVLYKNKELIIQPQNLGFLEIFINNYKIALIMLIGGFISLGIVSSFLLFFNGAVLGGIVMGIYNAYSIKPLITGVLPHFFFEITGLLIATAISYESIRILRFIIGKRKNQLD